jgi:hypothetical protein
LANNNEWQTQLSKQQKRQAKKPTTTFVPAKDLPLEARRLIFSWSARARASPKPDQELMAAINNCLYMKGAPHFHRIAHVMHNGKGTITATSAPRVDAKTLITHYWNKMVNAIREVDRAVLDIYELEKWVKLKVHGICLNRFISKGRHGVQKLQLEIQANHHSIQVLPGIHWLGNPRVIKEYYQAGDIQSSSAVFTVKGSKGADILVTKGVVLGDTRFTVKYYTQDTPDSQYVI